MHLRRISSPAELSVEHVSHLKRYLIINAVAVSKGLSAIGLLRNVWHCLEAQPGWSKQANGIGDLSDIQIAQLPWNRR
jgi:hypothetical protein